MKTTKLEKLNACIEAIEWVRTQKFFPLAWKNCNRGDWMLWLAKKLDVDDKKLTMAKAMIAKQVEHLMKDQRSRDALQACFNYVNGKITREQLNIYADAAHVVAAAATGAAYAAAAAAAGAVYAAGAAYAGAAYAAAATGAAYTAAAAAREKSLKKSADIYREYLTEEVIAKYKLI
jgi:hypothetical protein